LVSYLAYSSTLKTETKCSSKPRLAFSGLHSVILQKMELLGTAFVDPEVLTAA
jgi:hypothetical protein